MNNNKSSRRGDCCFARSMCVAFVPLLLSACAGEDDKSPQSGKIERSLEISGRWNLQSVTTKNGCGIAQNTSQLLVDIVQTGAEVTISTTKGTPLLHGKIEASTFMANASATVQADGRQFVYSLETQLDIENNTLAGEERFSFGSGEGDSLCSGKTQLTAVRSINRGRTVADMHPDQEPNDTVTGSIPVPVNVGIAGLVNAASDRVDVYALPLEKAGAYQIGVTGFGSSDLDVALVDKFQNLLASSENAGGFEEGVSFNVDAANNATLYVIVSGFETGEMASDYTLHVTAP